MPFANFFDSTVVVANRAVNGRSTRTFLEENRWQSIVEHLQSGDYVFIQFGHNDEVKTKESYTTKNDFKANLVTFVTETRSKGATPVLLTPVARRRFDDSGRVVGTHRIYSGLVREVAKAYDVPLIDLDEKSQALLQQLGPEDSKFFVQPSGAGRASELPGRQDGQHPFQQVWRQENRRIGT